MVMNKILIITGGTGGHVIPAVNFFKYLNQNSKNVFLLTDNRGEKYIDIIDKSNIFKIHSSHLAGNINFKFFGIIKLLIGFLQSFLIFVKLKPKTIISFGSYSSFTPLMCFLFFKFFYKTKLYLHEQNSIVGQTNKLFANQANKIFVNFDKEYPCIDKYKEKIIVVGLPQKKFKINFLNKKRKNFESINFLLFGRRPGIYRYAQFFY